MQGGRVWYELQDSDVVCFRSAAANADGTISGRIMGSTGSNRWSEKAAFSGVLISSTKGTGLTSQASLV